MPRTGIPYEKTWIWHFKTAFPDYDIIDRPMRGATTNRLVLEGGGGIDLLELYSPDIVIIQMGHAECAPRLFRKSGFEHFFMHRILPRRYFRTYINYIKKRRVRMPDCTDIDHSVTVNNIRAYIERCSRQNVKLVYFKIQRPNDYYITKSPYIGRNIERYNAALDTFASEYSCVTLADPIKNYHDVNSLCIDELHINPEGHLIYFREIEEIIKKISD